ncbi:MAG: F0F1 ATP synthase subunit epsilon [Tannerella sp.]|jgi:F-type H+-transporting ATPase subunit epsilon|nr:F0F1 ATP synthase subunit epsilon [Tannerella sp.]
MALKIKILSPAGMVYYGEVAHVTFPGQAGSFSVYPLHAPILSTLVKGDIVCYPSAGEVEKITVQSGFVEVKNDHITVCVEQLTEQNHKNHNHG